MDKDRFIEKFPGELVIDGVQAADIFIDMRDAPGINRSR